MGEAASLGQKSVRKFSSKKLGKTGQTLAASGQAGMADKATTQSSWAQVETMDKITTPRNQAPTEGAITRGNWAQVAIMDKITTQRHRAPVATSPNVAAK